MWKMYSPKRAEKVLNKHAMDIRKACKAFRVPEAALKAILYQELILMDVLDLVADLGVLLKLKPDSSTGYGQIFGVVALQAANYGVEKGLISYRQLGISTDHPLKVNDPADVRLVWKQLHRSPSTNIFLSCLNLRYCAVQMTGKTDFASMKEEELKLTLTRYNADVDYVTAYGERAYRFYQEFSGKKAMAKGPAR